MKPFFERLAGRKQTLLGFNATPAHAQGRIAAAGGPVLHRIAKSAR